MTTQIEERLAEEVKRAIKALRYAAHPHGSPNADALESALAEYEASRTRPAEGSEGRKIIHGKNCDCRNKVQCEDAEEAELHGTVRGRPIAPPPQPVAPERGEAKAVACHHDPYQGRCVHCDVPFVNGRSQPTPAPLSADSETVSVYRDVPSTIVNGMLHVLNSGQHPDYLISEGTLRDALCTLFSCPAPSALRYRDPTIEDALASVTRYGFVMHQDEQPEPYSTGHIEWVLEEKPDGDWIQRKDALNAIGAKMAEGEG